MIAKAETENDFEFNFLLNLCYVMLIMQIILSEKNTKQFHGEIKANIPCCHFFKSLD